MDHVAHGLPRGDVTGTSVPVNDTGETSAWSGYENPAENVVIAGMFIPNVPIELKPTIGMQFATLEEAYDFYNTYAWHSGFSVRKSSTRTLKSGLISRRVLRCSKAGFREEKVTGQDASKRKPFSITHCSCEVKLYLHMTDKQQNVYHVTQFVEVHNHMLCTPTKTHRLRSHKKFTADDLQIIASLKASGIGVSHSIDFLRSDVGGPSHLGFSERDARNALSRHRQSRYQSDASSMLQCFHTKSLEDNQFSYQIQVDEEMRITACFWVDGKSKEDYIVFNDVVCFDTTYKTNEYDMPFGPFVGVNYHMQTTLFGVGLLFGETVDDFKWLFQTWLDAMGGIHPKVIITDQDAAMGAAIAAIFPNVTHMLCLWHIQKKLPEKLLHVIHEHPTFKTSWNHCLYGIRSEEEFLPSWHGMIEECNLQDNSWLQHLFDIRHQWVPAYTNKIFTAGMRTTGRSESINAFFDGFVSHKSSLTDFALGYNKAVERRREAEEHSDFQCFHGHPVLKSRYAIEAQAAKEYTLNVFLIFQKELEESWHYSTERVGSEGVLQYWEVHRYEDHNGSNHRWIAWNEDEMEGSCSCRKFDSCGILCRHLLALFRCIKVVTMPSSFMLPRFMKSAKTQFKQIDLLCDNINLQSPAVRSHALARWWSSIKHEALGSVDAFEVVKRHAEMMAAEFQALKVGDTIAMPTAEETGPEEHPTGDAGDNFNLTADGFVQIMVGPHGLSSDTLATQSSQACGLLDPHIVVTKGRTAKRMK